MTFFYDLNKRLAALASKQDAEQITESAKAQAPRSKLAESMGVAEADYSAKKAAAGKDIGKPGKNFDKIATSAGKRYGSKAAGERVAGAVLNKLRHAKEDITDEGNEFSGALANAKKDHKSEFKVDGKTYPVQESHCPTCDCSPCECNSMEESAFQAAIGKKKYGDKGMKALQKAGREHASDKTMNTIRNKYDKYDESQGQADEGNAFTAALKATPKGNKFKVGNKEFTDTSDLEEGFKEMDAWLASREKEKGTGRYDKKKISTGTVYTRKPETFDDPETDPEATGGAPKRRGRPKSAVKGPERVTAKSWKHKNGRIPKKGNGSQMQQQQQQQQEDLDSDGVMMTRPSNMSSESVEHNSNAKVEAWNGLMDLCERGEGMEPAVLKRLKQLVRKLKPEELELDEEKVEAGKREFFDRLAPAAKQAVKVIKSISKGRTAVDEESTEKEDTQAERAGKKATKDIEHDDKKDRKEKKTESSKPDFLDVDKDGDKKEPMKKAAKDKTEEKVDETTVAGSVATAPAAAKKSAGGMQFGKGVYEGFDAQVESIITEGMNVTVNMTAGEDGQTHNSITVTAEGAEADQLAALLKMAGLHSQAAQSCGTCGNTPCGCEQTVDEAYGDTDETLNNPDWPTNTETLPAQPELRTYSGGLNGPKSTGQTTVPVVASQLRRQASMEESVELERNLFDTWKNYKG